MSCCVCVHCRYSVLMEIALQTCGILTSWNKAPLTLALTHGFNLLFRNLDATANLLANVDLRGKTILNTSKCTGYSMLGQMGVQKFSTMLEVDGKPFYQVDSSFGWFLPSVFEKQIGLDAGEKRECWHIGAGHAVEGFSLPADEDRIFTEASLGANTLRRRSNQVRFLDGVAFSKTGGAHGKGYGHGFKKVDKKDWFFSCHFWCDPVMPGSLGVEAMHQTFELLCVRNGYVTGIKQPTFAHELGKTLWKYRGQLTPKNDRCDVEVHVKSVEHKDGCVTVIADGFLYVDQLRVYQVNGLRLRIEPGQPNNAQVTQVSSASMPSKVGVKNTDALRRALLDVESDVLVFSPGGAEQLIRGVPFDALGSQSKAFMDFYGVKYPIYTGAMAKGIASADL
ncbi:MAG: hypothetical protein SGPRY_005331, partial [Prymnesium sp.]